MNKVEFKKLLLENDQYWSSSSPMQRLTTPLLQLGLWTRHGDFIGCYMTKSQRARAKRITAALADEVKRFHALPRLNHPQSLAFIQARQLLDELFNRWFPPTACRVIEFRRPHATGSARGVGLDGDANPGVSNPSLSD